MTYTLAILGCGTMGQAVLSAIYNAPKADSPEKEAQYPSKIVTINNSASGAEKVQKLVKGYGSSPNVSTVSCLAGPQPDLDAQVVVVATKPYQLEAVLKSYSKLFEQASQVISLAAGWTIEQIQLQLPKSTSVSRVMTNTPAKYGWGSAVISHSPNTNSDQKERSQELFQHLGMCVELPERNMDAATALVGSGPAFVLLMMESMMEGGIKMGIPLEESRRLAANVLEGTSKMAAATGAHPSVLKHQVCTPGGNTIAGLCTMEDRGVKSGIVRGIEEATRVAAQLGKKK
ncbi:PRO3 (YER023W) [Zygosaccharomyces parabailii]|uniref:Pyrroline-5-carboxylate reductase n=1 Tax=Zygosaccharomyces bailii (strain CLIB 213 / ATCC 58445 / CBS 680 / BCRC 21525 / NBRC 1098 / NCYC 1416 / NRRL Y-2227) TaxID=1333698 RepID=A0A8J2SZN6_ZYGB2|nr:PRO3 (YER023W) [Zygosaccharomyces parabailii]CDF87221.1 BN860_01530g1_1 [Zygosaccharomyces bailii CLIB 213]SJM88227.1 probable Pyrroline-5-carboxylate reductase [Zygosaccharomyces bailii]